MSMSVDLDKQATGARIQAARKSAGYKTIQSFAQALSCNQTQVVRWERGKTVPRAETLLAIARLCNVPVGALLGQKAAA